MAEKTIGFRIEVKGTEAQQKKLGILTGELFRLTEQRKRDRKAVQNASGSNSKLNQQLAQTELRMKNTRAAITRNTRAIQQFGQQTKKSGGLALAINKGLTNSFKTLGKTLAIAFGAAAVLRGIGNVVNIFKDFEQAQANLAAVLGVSRDEMAALTQQAKDLGGTTAFTASEVAGLQRELAKLGFTQEEILNATGAILDLAAAAGAELPRAAEIAGATIRSLGLDTSETRRVVDVMAKSFSSSALTLEKFATAMATVGPIAKVAGLSIERITALLGTLADRGLDASTSGTSLRNIFLELSKQGLTFEEAMGKINNATDKSVVALDLFGKRGATSAIILAENAEAAANLEEKLNDAGGAAQRMAEEQLDTLTGDTIKLTSAWEGFILSLEDGEGGLATSIRTIIQFTAAVLQAGTALSRSTEQLQEALIRETVTARIKAIFDEFEAGAGRAIVINDELILAQKELAANTAFLADIERQIKDARTDAEAEEIIKNVFAQVTAAKDLVAVNTSLITELEKLIKVDKEKALNDKVALEIQGEQIRNVAFLEAAIKSETEAIKAETASIDEIRVALIARSILQAELNILLGKTKDVTKELREENRKFAREFKESLKELDSNLQALLDTEIEWLRVFKETSKGRIQGLLEESEARAQLRLLDAANLEESIDAQFEIEDAAFQVRLENLKLRQNATEEEVRAFDAKLELLATQHERNKTKIAKSGDLVRAKIASEFLSFTSQLLNETSSIFEASKQRELSAAGDNAEKREEIEKKFSKKQKAIAISNALIQQALGIIRILSSVITGNPLIDVPIKALLIAGQTLATGIQIDAIQSAVFAEGGRIPGKFDGKDNILIRVSKGEVILNPEQQDALGGDVAFSRAKVPGFEGVRDKAPVIKKLVQSIAILRTAPVFSALPRFQGGGSIDSDFSFGARLPATNAQFGVSLPSPLAGIVTQATGQSQEVLSEDFAILLGETVATEVNDKVVTVLESDVTGTQADVETAETLSKF